MTAKVKMPILWLFINLADVIWTALTEFAILCGSNGLRVIKESG